MKRVEITWVDSYSLPDRHWVKAEDVAEIIADQEEIIVSFGFLVAENDRMVAVASSWHELENGANVGGIICIPKVSITKRRFVR